MQLNDEPQSHYDILELTTDATPQEIRSAYLRLKSSYSKDNLASYSVYSREETEELLSKIEEAYLVLSNPERRRAYDQSNQIASDVMSGMDHPMYRPEPVPAPVMPSISGPSLTQTIPEPFFNSHEIDGFVATDMEWTGASLKRIRESKRISIEDLSDYTRISKNYLIAIEDEAFDRLPAAVYVRGFLQQISKRLKLPTEVVVNKFIQRLKSARPDKF